MSGTQAHDRERGREEVTERVTVRVPESLDEDYEAMVEESDLYNNKSQAMRAALRAHRDLLSTEGDDAGE